LYNPIVTCFGDGSNTGGVGVPTAIDVYDASVANQAAPAGSVVYNYNTAGGLCLVNAANNNAEAALANNPALATAASQGLPYSGVGYAYSAGYNTGDGLATSSAGRSVGVVTVGASVLSNPTVLYTQTAANAYDGSTIRAAVGDDTGPASAAIYTAGSYGTGEAATGGWRNFVTNTQLYSGNANTRTVAFFGSQLFGAMSSGSTVGIYLINTSGSNPSTGATSWIATGTSSNHSPYGFVLFDNTQNLYTSNGYNVAYIADDGSASSEATGAAGIEKWVYNGSAWTQAYTLLDSTLPASAAAYHGVAGELDTSTGNAVLFATTKDGSTLQQITDPLAATDPGTPATDSYLTLATASTDYFFRGVALAPVPEPSTLALLAAGAIGLLAYAWRRRNGA
jgi:hypothetical protein